MPDERAGVRPDHRSLLVAIAAPLVVIVSELLMAPRSPALRVSDSVYAFLLVFRVGVLSWCVGRFISVVWLRWTVFVWSVVLIDLLVFTQYAHGSSYGEGVALVTAQATLLIAWAVLGAVRWAWRVFTLLLAACAIIPVAVWGVRNWGDQAWVSVLLLTIGLELLVAALAWIRGLRIAVPAVLDAQEHKATWTGFGVVHMLAWSTALAPLLWVLQQTGWNLPGLVTAWECFVGQPWIAVCLAVLIATGSLAVVYLMLAQRAKWWALAVALMAVTSASSTLIVWSALRRMLVRGWGGYPYTMDDLVIEMHTHWLVWFSIAYGVLAALLLFFQASGYRLVRLRRDTPEKTTGESSQPLTPGAPSRSPPGTPPSSP